MTRGRRIFAAVLVAIGAIVYGVSPIDIIPELLTGPLGLADDFAVLAGAGYGIWKLLKGRKGGTPPPAGTAPPST
jgi:uncharacterized membrane protein YkvA (DUF1232 family)